MTSQRVGGSPAGAGFPVLASQIITLANDDVVQCNVSVPLEAAEAFETFRHDIFCWWPHDFTLSGAVVENLFFEGRRGGMLWERGPEGFRVDWARVLRWLPPEKIILRWHLGPSLQPQPDITAASTVEIRFATEAGNRTRIELDHRDILRHGRGATEYRAFLASEGGWRYILDGFARYCAARVPQNENSGASASNAC